MKSAAETQVSSQSSGVLSLVSHYVLPILILAGGFAGFFLLKSLKKDPESVIVKSQAPRVTTIPVRFNTSGLEITVDGEVIPYREVAISAEVAGRIEQKSLNCRAGRYVRQGDLLLAIDPSDYELEIQRLGEQLKKADDSLDELDIEEKNTAALLELADETVVLKTRELQRIQSLAKRGISTEAEVDLAKADELTARNSRQNLKNTQRLFSARRNGLLREKQRISTELERAQLDLERTQIVAPLSGVIMEANVEQDAYVQRGTLLLAIEDTSKVEVRFNLRLDRLRWLWQKADDVETYPLGQNPGNYELPRVPVTIALELDGQQYRWQGLLSRYDGAGINAATRTVPCIAVVDDPRAVEAVGGDSNGVRLPAPPTLLRGMFVTVKIRVPSKSGLFEIPDLAIQPGNRVWLLRDNKLAIVRVRVAQTLDGTALVVEEENGVGADDEVIVTPLPIAVEGMDLQRRVVNGSDGQDFAATEAPAP